MIQLHHSLSAGMLLSGKTWKRENDNLGIAYAASGISKPHRDYLKAGGKGFMLGDGNLTYSPEQLTECFYSLSLMNNNIYLSATYQLLINPGYNSDRKGPVNIFSLRVHLRI